MTTRSARNKYIRAIVYEWRETFLRHTASPPASDWCTSCWDIVCSLPSYSGESCHFCTRHIRWCTWIRTSGSDTPHRIDLLFVENNKIWHIPSYGTELHEGLVITSAVESDRNIFGPVLIEEEQASRQCPIGIEWRTNCLNLKITSVKFVRLTRFIFY